MQIIRENNGFPSVFGRSGGSHRTAGLDLENRLQLRDYGEGGQALRKEDAMSKMSDRDRLADLEARQRSATEAVARARSALRAKYAAMVSDLPVEEISEREFREALGHLVRLGGARAISALKAVPNAPHQAAKG
jgi:hypothetical protein